MNWDKLKIRTRWKQIVVYDESWRLLTEDELRKFADAILALCDHVHEIGTQEQVIQNDGIAFLRTTIKNAIWFFCPTKNQRRSHTGCVYFIRDPRSVSVTKIGYTAELGHRIRGLTSVVTDNNHDLELIAVAYTDDFKLLETAIHQYLARCHTSGEWFLSDGVDSFLTEVKQIAAQ